MAGPWHVDTIAACDRYKNAYTDYPISDVNADLLGFFGAFGFAPMTFWMPSVIWLVVMKPSKKSLDYWLNIINIIVFVIIMFLAAIGSIYSIIQDSKTYKFYQ